MSTDQKIAVVTGGNRGIGFEVCRQLAKQGLRVVLTSRDRAKGTAAVDALKSEGLEVLFHPLAVTEPESIAQLAEFLQQLGRLDVLVNNAGIYLKDDDSILTTPVDIVRETIETNLYAPLQLCQTLVPLMQKQNYGRIINVSSGMGQLNDMGGGSPAYRISKTALNALTRILAAELRDRNILVNSVCPGWVKTDMGGAGAPRSTAQGADTIVWLATSADNSTTGGFFRDRQPIPW